MPSLSFCPLIFVRVGERWRGGDPCLHPLGRTLIIINILCDECPAQSPWYSVMTYMEEWGRLKREETYIYIHVELIYFVL